MVPAPPPIPTSQAQAQAQAQAQLQQQHQQQQQQPQAPQPSASPVNPRKRRASMQQSAPMTTMGPPSLSGNVEGEGNQTLTATPEAGSKKKGRTNTPWTAEEEQRLKTMRDAGNTWSEIAKVCRLSHESFLKGRKERIL